MAFEDSSGRNVPTFYGPRTATEGVGGEYNVGGSLQELVLEFTGQNITDDVWAVQSNALLPAGCRPIRAIVEISEAFVLGGTTPTIDIGTDGSEGTNGFDIAEADAEAVGVYIDETFAGTWGARLAADTTVSVALGGSSPTNTAAGRAKVTIQYSKV